MAGLDLRTGFSLRGSGGTGNYTPQTPASAMPPTAAYARQAYGINGSGADPTTGGNIAWMGSVAVGAAAIAILGYLWWSLPR